MKIKYLLIPLLALAVAGTASVVLAKGHGHGSHHGKGNQGLHKGWKKHKKGSWHKHKGSHKGSKHHKHNPVPSHPLPPAVVPGQASPPVIGVPVPIPTPPVVPVPVPVPMPPVVPVPQPH